MFLLILSSSSCNVLVHNLCWAKKKKKKRSLAKAQQAGKQQLVCAPWLLKSCVCAAEEMEMQMW